MFRDDNIIIRFIGKNLHTKANYLRVYKGQRSSERSSKRCEVIQKLNSHQNVKLIK